MSCWKSIDKNSKSVFISASNGALGLFLLDTAIARPHGQRLSKMHFSNGGRQLGHDDLRQQPFRQTSRMWRGCSRLARAQLFREKAVTARNGELTFYQCSQGVWETRSGAVSLVIDSLTVTTTVILSASSAIPQCGRRAHRRLTSAMFHTLRACHVCISVTSLMNWNKGPRYARLVRTASGFQGVSWKLCCATCPSSVRNVNTCTGASCYARAT